MIFQNTTSIYLVSNKNMGELNHIILSPKLHDALLPQVHRTCRMFSRQGDPLMNLHGHFQAIITSQVGPSETAAGGLSQIFVQQTCGGNMRQPTKLKVFAQQNMQSLTKYGDSTGRRIDPLPKDFCFPHEREN
jgi:hypothetical protein